MARHAVAREDKEARSAAILGAAHTLFVAGDGTLPGAAEIAAAAGLAKGTLYLYFRTKEEIFIGLLLRSCLDLLAETEAALKAAKGRRADKVAAFLASYVGHLGVHPELLRLDGLCYGVLEKNIDERTLLAFKLAFFGRLERSGAALDETLRLAQGRGVSLLLRTFALTRGLWQSSQPHAWSEAALAAAPAFATAQLDFGTELTEALAEYWRGALTAAAPL